MKQPCDLHTHTTASDGQYRPAQAAAMAKRAGIAVLAVTDHDTIGGVEEAAQAGREQGLTVLRGVELGAKENRHLHILGLNLRAGCQPMEALCSKLRQSREERKYRILAFLKEKGVEIPLEEVEELAAGGVVARPHFARVMLRHGYVSTTEEAFARYLDTDEYQRIERWKAGAEECIDVIHQSGGKAVLAHPYQLGLSPQELERAVARLKDAGLDGIECYYPRHTPEMTEQYLGLAARYGLHVTGGSDFHGEAVHPDMPLAPTLLEIDWLLASH